MKIAKLKSLWLLPAITFTASVLFFACSKDIKVNTTTDNNTTNPGNSVPNKLTAVIAGDSFISSQVSAIVNDSMVIITGFTSNGNKIALNINLANPQVGIFEINEVTKHSAVYHPVTDQPYFANSFATGGQIRIMFVDTANKKMSGAFFFQGKQSNGTKTAIVTGGEFQLTYTNAKTPPINLNDTVYSNNPKSTLNDMFAVIKNGTATDSVTFQFSESFYYLGNLHISGYNLDKKRIMIACDPKVKGTQSLNGNFGPNSAYYVAALPNGQVYSAVSGSMNVTLNDTVQRHMVATFNFSGKLNASTPPDTREVTSGTFSFYY